MSITPKQYAVMLVEDESFLSKVLAERLEDEGFGRIDLAGNGEEAMQKMKANPPDILLLDMILPKKNGFEVLQEMKQDPKLQQIPVLVLSNLGQDQDIEQAKALGATDYLVKSNFSLQKVISKMYSILETSSHA